MGLYSTFATNKDLEVSGTWIEYGEFAFLLARSGGGNKKYERCMTKHTKPYRRLLQSGNAQADASTEKKLNEVLALVYAESVILDWRGVTDADGNHMECNLGNKLKVLTDLPALFDDIRKLSEDIANFRVVDIEEDSKN